MLRFLIVASVIALGCTAIALPASIVPRSRRRSIGDTNANSTAATPRAQNHKAAAIRSNR